MTQTLKDTLSTPWTPTDPAPLHTADSDEIWVIVPAVVSHPRDAQMGKVITAAALIQRGDGRLLVVALDMRHSRPSVMFYGFAAGDVARELEERRTAKPAGDLTSITLDAGAGVQLHCPQLCTLLVKLTGHQRTWAEMRREYREELKLIENAPSLTLPDVRRLFRLLHERRGNNPASAQTHLTSRTGLADSLLENVPDGHVLHLWAVSGGTLTQALTFPVLGVDSDRVNLHETLRALQADTVIRLVMPRHPSLAGPFELWPPEVYRIHA